MLRQKIIKNIFFLAVIVLSFVLFTSLMETTSLLLGDKKADLTQKHRYSISNESLNIAENLPKRVNITLYMSKDLSAEYPELGIQSQYLLRLLNKYQAASKGKININVKSPEPYSATEYEAKSEKIRAFPDNSNTKNLYFGAVFSNNLGEKYTIPYFSIQRQNYTEYDISRILAKLSGYNKAQIGVISYGGNIMDWQAFNKIKEDYVLTELSRTSISIPKEIKTLILYAPQKVDEKLTYALDQFIMRGGNLILFIDPYAETIAQRYPYTKKNTISLLPWLNHLGIFMDENKIIQDMSDNKTNYFSFLDTQNTENLYFEINQAQINTPDEIAKPHKLSFSSAGEITVSPISSATYTKILTTSENIGTLDTNIAKTEISEKIINNLKKEKGNRAIGYLVEGWFESFYPDSIYGNISDIEILPPFVLSSLKPSKIFIFSDSDFLADTQWNAINYLKGARVYDQVPSNNNADFLLSLVDYMSNNTEMAKLRVNYLYTDDYSIADQISAKIYRKYQKEYLQKDADLRKLQKEFLDFQDAFKSKKNIMSLSKIQEYDDFIRKIHKLNEEKKVLDYQVQQEIMQKVNYVMLENMIFYPFLLLLFITIITKLYLRCKRKQEIGMLHE